MDILDIILSRVFSKKAVDTQIEDKVNEMVDAAPEKLSVLEAIAEQQNDSEDAASAVINSITTKANVSDLNAHTVDTNLHTSAAEKASISNHISDSIIHTSSTEKAVQSEHQDNEDIHVNSTDKVLWNNKLDKVVGNINTLGGVRPVVKTSNMTQDVGVDSNGRLYTAPTSTPDQPIEPSPSILIPPTDTNNIFGVCYDPSNPTEPITRLTAQNDPNHWVTYAPNIEPIPGNGSTIGLSWADYTLPWNGMRVKTLNEGVFVNSTANSSSGISSWVYVPSFNYIIKKELPESNDVQKLYIYICAGDIPAGESDTEWKVGGGFHIGSVLNNINQLPIPSDNYAVNISLSNCISGLAARSVTDNVTYKLLSKKQLDDINLLYMIEYASTNSDLIGQGTINASAPIEKSYTSNIQYHTGIYQLDETHTVVQYRWIENLWSNLYQWISGLGCKNYNFVYNSNYNNITTESQYVDTGLAVPNTGFIKSLIYTNGILLPAETGGSSSTYISDSLYKPRSTNMYYSCAGGSYKTGVGSGLFCLDVSASGSLSTVGSRTVVEDEGE